MRTRDTYSPSKVAVLEAKLTREMAAARTAGDVPAMQRVLQQRTTLRRNIYG